ncbi:MAG: YceD family protein [Nakamurella sp.]
MTYVHLHHASPWAINTRAEGLSHRDGPGLTSPLDIFAAPPMETMAGVLEVLPTSMVTVQGRLESVTEGVLVSATVTADANGTCSRCLREITVPLRAYFRELYAYPDSLTAETSDPDEVPRIVDDFVDLGPLVHDELVLAMPAIPLCREDCPGLCSECGESMDRVGPDHRHEILDPRWAALAGLLDQSTLNPAQLNPADLNPADLNPAQKEK